MAQQPKAQTRAHSVQYKEVPPPVRLYRHCMQVGVHGEGGERKAKDLLWVQLVHQAGR